MSKLIFQFSNSGLSLLKQLPQWATMVMSFRWQSYQVFQAIVIPNPIDMMNLPFWWCRAMSIFPNHDMFKYLMTGISTWVVSEAKQNIAISVFYSPPFPIWIFLTRISSSVFKAKFRTTENHFPADRARMFMAVFICFATFMGFIIAVLIFYSFICSHIKIIAEREVASKLMREKPRYDSKVWFGG